MAYTPNAISGPASSTSGNLPSFNNTTGNSVDDSGVAIADVVVDADLGTAAAADIGVTAGNVVQVDQAVTATTRDTTTVLGTTLNHTLSDTSDDIDTFNGVAGVTYSCRALGAGTIVAGAGLIITQTGATITTAAGDTFDVEMITSTTCRIKNYTLASGEALVGGDSFARALLHVQEQQSAGTDAGTFTSGSWQTRTLNTVVTNEISGASLGSNQITLPAGTYIIEASLPGYRCDLHKGALYNTSDTAFELQGTSEKTTSASAISTRSFITGKFTISAEKVFELQHRCSSTKGTDGFGVASNFGVTEIYADVMIWKVA